MTYHKQLEAAIKEIQEIKLKEEENFFTKELLPKLQVVKDLMLFSNIHHAGLSEYLEFFRNDIQVDMERCKLISPGKSIAEREQLLEIIKQHIKVKLRIVEYAFAYHLKDKSALFQEVPQASILKITHWANEHYPVALTYSKS